MTAHCLTLTDTGEPPVAHTRPRSSGHLRRLYDALIAAREQQAARAVAHHLRGLDDHSLARLGLTRSGLDERFGRLPPEPGLAGAHLSPGQDGVRVRHAPEAEGVSMPATLRQAARRLLAWRLSRSGPKLAAVLDSLATFGLRAPDLDPGRIEHELTELLAALLAVAREPDRC